MTDILLLYESRSREIENCVLLATELELRGYKVKIKNIYSPFRYFTKPRVLIVPHLYNEKQIIEFAKNFWLSNKAILDLQYEQILGTEIAEDDIHNPQGQAKYAQHIAWGYDQASRYRQIGIPEKNIHVTGSMSMDLMKPDFEGYFLSKKQIAKEFNLEESCEWVLFISSFSYANRTERELDYYEKMDPNARQFNKLSDKSFLEIIYWLKCAAKEFPNKIFIYRPHPAEKINQELYKIETEINNFHLISSYSMRQWAKVADKVYNWYSTSIVDIYYAHKTCYILRPVEIPLNMEVSILNDSDKIESYSKFVESLKDNSFYFPLSSKVIEYYYGISDSQMSYIKTADICENLLEGNLEGYNYDYGRNRFDMFNSRNLFSIIRNYISIIFYIFFILFRVKKFPFNKNKNKQAWLYSKDVYGIRKDIMLCKRKLYPIILKIHKKKYGTK